MPKKYLSLVLLVLLACIWGSSFILMKRGMETAEKAAIFSDAQVGALRMLLASLALLPFALPALRKLGSARDFFALAVVGCCGNFFPAFLFTYAETELSSGYAGMLNSFTPIFTLLLGVLFFRQKLNGFQLTGVLIAFVGMVLLMWSGNDLSGKASFYHAMAVIVATLCYAVSLNTIKHRLQHLSSMEITSLAFALLFIPSLLSSFSLDTLHVFEHNPHAWTGFGYIAILSVVGTAFAVFLFNRVIALSSTLFASSVTYLIPIVAVLIGTYHGETITWTQVGCMLIVLAGVFVANYAALLFKTKPHT